MTFKPRPYQEDLISKINTSKSIRKCVTLATGGGKTFIFQELIKTLVGRTLVLVHRTELKEQTKTNADILMAQTFVRRKIDVNQYDNLIIDECHRGEFTNTAKAFKGNLYGFTATPMAHWTNTIFRCFNCLNEYDSHKKCCNKETVKIIKQVPLSSVYGELIEGATITELLKGGYLVEDRCYELPNKLLNQLKFDSTGNETNKSAQLVFGSKQAIKNTIKTYESICKGKKTLIFNSNTVINKALHEEFISQGYTNVKRIDSKGGDKRKEAIEWFRNTSDAILLNVHILTTGFDVTDVQSIILNKKTNSLPLFLQIVGRGGRITDKIYKPYFDCVDLGANIQQHGRWSSHRNWHKLYTAENERVSKPKPLAVRQCHFCDFIMPVQTLTCPECNQDKLYRGGSFAIPEYNGSIPLPNVNKILEYCERNDLEMKDARNLVYNHIASMFVTNPQKHITSGKMFAKLKPILIPMYFAIQNSNLRGNKYRTLNAFINETIKRISNTTANLPLV